MIEGAPAAAGHEGEGGEGIDITVPTAEEGAGANAGEQQGEAEERRELVLANQSRLHPGEQRVPQGRREGSISEVLLKCIRLWFIDAWYSSTIAR